MERMLLLMLNFDLTLALEAGLFGSSPNPVPNLGHAILLSSLVFLL